MLRVNHLVLFLEKSTYKILKTDFHIHILVWENSLLFITRQNQWGKPKLTALNQILKGFELIKATSIPIINNYGIIDAYSQGKLKDKPLPKGMSARNMGKNDLWIAASAMA